MFSGYDLAALVAVYTLIAAVVDYRSKKIPNWLTVPTAVLGLLFNSFAPHGIGPLWALAGFAVGFVLLLLPWILGGGGMGDVKMLAALGAWLGPVWILWAFGLGSCLAAAMAIAIMIGGTFTEGVSVTQRRFLNRGGSVTATGTPRKLRRVLPFAVPMAIATWCVLAWMITRGAQS